ncbi:MAG: hypothetical protein JO247_11045 [Chloroflexi bacterium]|nr:hypothetical protein [Chloroflexota bacterium]
MATVAAAVRRSGSPSASRWLVAAVLLGADLLVSAGATYACDYPIDAVNATRNLPGQTTLAVENTPDFLAHKAIAVTLDAAGCNPLAGGLQWIKAAAHTVRQDRELEVIDGLRGEAKRSAAPPQLAADLCSYLRPGSARVRQEQELAAAGLPCS